MADLAGGRFCGHNCEDEQFRGSWKDVMARAARVMAMDFLYYLCDNYRIRSEGTSWEYFRQFKQLFSCVNGRYMDTNDCKEILKVPSPQAVSKPALTARAVPRHRFSPPLRPSAAKRQREARPGLRRPLCPSGVQHRVRHRHRSCRATARQSVRGIPFPGVHGRTPCRVRRQRETAAKGRLHGGGLRTGSNGRL